MHEQDHKQFSTLQKLIKAYFCFKFRHMSYKEEPRKKKLSSPFIFQNFFLSLLNHAKIHVIYVKKKKFLTKIYN